jgi:hypothetical protein
MESNNDKNSRILSDEELLLYINSILNTATSFHRMSTIAVNNTSIGAILIVPIYKYHSLSISVYSLELINDNEYTLNSDKPIQTITFK